VPGHGRGLGARGGTSDPGVILTAHVLSAAGRGPAQRGRRGRGRRRPSRARVDRWSLGGWRPCCRGRAFEEEFPQACQVQQLMT